MPEPTPPTAGQDRPQQAPMGVSSITGPTPNKGYEAAVSQRMGSWVNQMLEAIPMVGASSEIGQLLLDTVKKLSKHVQPGMNNPASERNNLQRQLMQNQQQQQMMQQMRPQMPPGGGQMPPGGPPMAQGAPRAA